MIGVLADHGATMASVGMPPSISRAGAGAWTTTCSQARQAYLGRRNVDYIERKSRHLRLCEAETSGTARGAGLVDGDCLDAVQGV